MRTILRKILSRLAVLTPGVFYYSRSMRVEIAEDTRRLALTKGGEITGLGLAAMGICSQLSDEMKPGDYAMFSLEGVEHGDVNHGDFRVFLMRAGDDPERDFHEAAQRLQREAAKIARDRGVPV